MESFDIKKFFSLDGLGFMKLLAFGFKALVIVAIIILLVTVFRFFTPKKDMEKAEIHQADKVTIYQGAKQRTGFTTGVFGGLHNSGDEYFVGVKVSKEW